MPDKKKFDKQALKKTLVAGVLGVVMTNRLLIPTAGAVAQTAQDLNPQDTAPYSVSGNVGTSPFADLVMYDAVVPAYGDEDDLEPLDEPLDEGGEDNGVDTPLPPWIGGGGGAGVGGGGAGGGAAAAAAVTPPPPTPDPVPEVIEIIDLPGLQVPLAAWQGWTSPFVDVAAGAWFYNAVRFMNVSGLMLGTADGQFSPNLNLDRRMAITILARTAGVETGVGAQWYVNAVNWGMAEGITDGTHLTENITREQFATMLFRHAEFMEVDTSARASLAAFGDQQAVSGWAQEAMSWAVASGIIMGRGEATLAPQGTTTRAEVATMMERFMTTFDLFEFN